MNEKTIFRKTKNRASRYVVISKEIAQAIDLTAKDKGIMFYLMSLPDDWEIHLGEIVKHFADGRASIYNGIRRLIEKGYIRRSVIRDENGRIIKFEYQVFETPLRRIKKALKVDDVELMKDKQEADAEAFWETDKRMTDKMVQESLRRQDKSLIGHY